MWCTVVAINAWTEPRMLDNHYTEPWHNAENAQERSWLDEWTRGSICPVTLFPCPAPTTEADTISVPALASTAGRP